MVMLKCVACFGVYGALRRAEICELKCTDVKIYEDHILIKVPPKKTQKKRTFILPKLSTDLICPVFYFKKYMEVRKDKDQARLFIRISKRKNGFDSCFNQPIGVNTIGTFPNEIARWLNLSDPHQFTGHTFRRTAATLLAEEGGSLFQIKRLGGWKGNAVVEGYIDSTTRSQIQIANLISSDQSGNTPQNPITKRNINLESHQNEVDELERILTPQDFEYMIEKIMRPTPINNTNILIDKNFNNIKNQTPHTTRNRTLNETPTIDQLFDLSNESTVDQFQDQPDLDLTSTIMDYQVHDISFLNNSESEINNNNLMFEGSLSLSPMSSPVKTTVSTPLSCPNSPLANPNKSPQESPQMSQYNSFSSPRSINNDQKRSNESSPSRSKFDQQPTNNLKDTNKTFNIKKCKHFTFNIYTTPNNS